MKISLLLKLIVITGLVLPAISASIIIAQEASPPVILECVGTGSGGDSANFRGIRFTVNQDFSSIESRFAGRSAGSFTFDAELRRSSDFSGSADFVSTVTVNLGSSGDGAPYTPVLFNFGNIPVNSSETFTLKFVPQTAPSDLFMEVFGIGTTPCTGVEQTNENSGTALTERGDPAGFRVFGTEENEPSSTVLECSGTGTGGDLADLRAIRFTVNQDFSSIESRFAGRSAGVFTFDAELRRSSDFSGSADFVSTVTVSLGSSDGGTPYTPVLFNFGNVPVDGSETFTLKFIIQTGSSSLFMETFGIGSTPCVNVEQTDENSGSIITERGDPAGFRVFGVESEPNRPNNCIDVTMSLHREPTIAERVGYETIFEYFADSIFEMSNTAHQICDVIIYQNGENWSSSDIRWGIEEWPRAIVSGIADVSYNMFMGDVFPFDTPYDALDSANSCGSGYTLGHEWGHYYYGLKDEYAQSQGEIASNAVMANQWRACPNRGGDLDYLNFSVPSTINGPNGQTTFYSASAWETLIRIPSNDPEEGFPIRPYYPELSAVAPVAGILPAIDLPDGTAQSALNVTWIPPTASSFDPTRSEYEAFVMSVEGDTLNAPTPMNILAGVSNLTSYIAGATVDAMITQPDDTSLSVTLVDNGTGIDQFADDGIYTGQFLYTQVGTHNISVEFSNENNTATTTQLAFDHVMAPDGELFEVAHSIEPVFDSFEVSDETTIVVESAFSSVPTSVGLDNVEVDKTTQDVWLLMCSLALILTIWVSFRPI